MFLIALIIFFLLITSTCNIATAMVTDDPMNVRRLLDKIVGSSTYHEAMDVLAERATQLVPEEKIRMIRCLAMEHLSGASNPYGCSVSECNPHPYFAVVIFDGNQYRLKFEIFLERPSMAKVSLEYLGLPISEVALDIEGQSIITAPNRQ